VSVLSHRQVMPALSPGDRVIDLDVLPDEPDPMMVVGIDIGPANSYTAYDDKTVADVNPDYPSDDSIVEVVYPPFDGGFEESTRYSFPRSRVRLLDPSTSADRFER